MEFCFQAVLVSFGAVYMYIKQKRVRVLVRVLVSVRGSDHSIVFK